MNFQKTLGLIFLTYLGFLVVIRTLQGNVHILLWVSNAVLLLAGVGLLFENNLLVSSAVLLIAIPHSLWILDALLKVAGLPSFGTTDYLWDNTLFSITLSLHHFAVLPMLIAALLRQAKIHKWAWLLSGGYLMSLSVLVLALTPYNINCARQLCDMPFLSALGFLEKLSLPLYFMAVQIIMLAVFWLSYKIIKISLNSIR